MRMVERCAATECLLFVAFGAITDNADWRKDTRMYKVLENDDGLRVVMVEGFVNTVNSATAKMISSKAIIAIMGAIGAQDLCNYCGQDSYF